MNPISIEQIRKAAEREKDVKRTVSFNYPKYEEIGTPHHIWVNTVDRAEKGLETIFEGQPLREEFPLTHYRREERDESGRLIRVHLDVLGRATMVELALQIFRSFEQEYMLANQVATESGMKEFRALLEKVPELINKIGFLTDLGIEIPGVTPSKQQVPEDSITKLDEYDGPLDLAPLNEEAEKPAQKKEMPFFIMPNPAPDDFN